MDRETLLSELPHLLVLFALVAVSIPFVRVAVPADYDFWATLLVAVLIGIFYRPVVTRLGYAPDHWT